MFLSENMRGHRENLRPRMTIFKDGFAIFILGYRQGKLVILRQVCVNGLKLCKLEDLCLFSVCSS